MSADVIPFAAPERVKQPRPAKVGDLAVCCVNVALGLWCAWPISEVDDDGWPALFLVKTGGRVAAERVSGPERTVYHRADFIGADGLLLPGFEALRWRTWSSFEAAAEAFGELRGAV